MPQTLWKGCRLTDDVKAKLLADFITGVSARQASVGICSRPAAERFYHLIRCTAMQNLRCEDAFALETASGLEQKPKSIVVGIVIQDGAIHFCPDIVASVDRRFDIWRAHTGDHTIDGFDGPAEEARHAL